MSIPPSADARGPVRVAPRATVVAWVLPHLVAHVAARGHDAGPLKRLPGLRGRDLDDPDARVPDETAREAWRRAAAATGDDSLGLHMAQALPAGALDLVEYAFRSSPTVHDGVQRLARYGRLLNDRAAVQVDADESHLRIVLGRPGLEPIPQRAEFSMALVLRLVRETTGQAVAPVAVTFVHPAPEATFEHDRFFRSRVAFGAPANAMVFSAADAALPLRTADPALAGVVARRLDRLMQLRRSGEQLTVAGRVREALVDGAGRREPVAGAIARELGLSPRTLARRLAAEGTTFRAVLDRAREEAARTLLGDRSMGVAEIAFLLGYSEPAAFHRSFKRWTGTTPLAWRKERRAA